MPDGALTCRPARASIELALHRVQFWRRRRCASATGWPGFDQTWHDVGTRRVAYYSRLPPGDYRFEVLAANNDGVWSTHRRAPAVVVLPFWWQRPRGPGAPAWSPAR